MSLHPPTPHYCIYLQRGNIWTDGNLNWLHPWSIELALVAYQPRPLLVGYYQDKAVYLYLIEPSSERMDAIPAMSLIHGRQLLNHLDATQSQLLSRALQLGHWLSNHQYCGRCGQQTQLADHELTLRCPTCQLSQYPRISPCIIVAVMGSEGLLLAHNANHPPGRYSTLAGFVDAGESIEAAVHREVYEEVGVTVGELEYMGSQSWAFPHSLMLGFLAQYKSGQIQVDGEEITSAQWFTQATLPDLPPSYSIARQLIETALARLNI